MIDQAKRLLDEGNYTCVICGENLTLTAVERGVKPLAAWLEEGRNLAGCWAADKVVGKATAYLYCLLKVRGVYARVMSRPALEVLRANGIEARYNNLAEYIINRRGDGMCPFEQAVLEAESPASAWPLIRQKLQMQ